MRPRGTCRPFFPHVMLHDCLSPEPAGSQATSLRGGEATAVIPFTWGPPQQTLDPLSRGTWTLSANSQEVPGLLRSGIRGLGEPSLGQADAQASGQCVGGAQDQFRLKPLDSMAASRSLSSSFSRSRCSSSRATRASLCSTTSSISFRIFFSSDSSSSVFR